MKLKEFSKRLNKNVAAQQTKTAKLPTFFQRFQTEASTLRVIMVR